MTPEVPSRDIDALHRIAVVPVPDAAALLKRVEDLARELGGMVAERRAASDARWWRHQDVLDDLLDIRDYLRWSGDA